MEDLIKFRTQIGYVPSVIYFKCFLPLTLKKTRDLQVPEKFILPVEMGQH
jgi:hypothetical protein